MKIWKRKSSRPRSRPARSRPGNSPDRGPAAARRRPWRRYARWVVWTVCGLIVLAGVVLCWRASRYQAWNEALARTGGKARTTSLLPRWLEGAVGRNVGRLFDEVASLDASDSHQPLDEILDNLPTLKHLRGLSLATQPVTDEAVERLTELSRLEELDLSQTQITDDGLKPLAEMTNLRRLLLSGTAVTDDGLANLHPLVRLEELDLRDTQVRRNGAEELGRVLARCRIYPFVDAQGGRAQAPELLAVAKARRAIEQTGEPMDSHTRRVVESVCMGRDGVKRLNAAIERLLEGEGADDRARGAAEALLFLLGEEEDEEIRRNAALALARLSREGGFPDDLTARSVEAFRRHDDATVQQYLAETLANIGPPASEAVDALTAMLGHEDPSNRKNAALALGRIGRAAEPATEALLGALGDEHPLVRGQAAAALGEINPNNAAVVPALIERLDDQNDYVQVCAVTALGKLGLKAEAAVEPLTKLAERGGPLLRDSAKAALEAISTRGQLDLAERLLGEGRPGPAAEACRDVLAAEPENGRAHALLGDALARQGHVAQAIDQYRQAVSADPANLPLRRRVAWNLAVNGEGQIRDAGEAARLAEAICLETEFQEPGGLDVLAAARAEQGRFEQAASWARRAIAVAAFARQVAAAEAIRSRLQCYERGEAYREGDATRLAQPLPIAPNAAPTRQDAFMPSGVESGGRSLRGALSDLRRGEVIPAAFVLAYTDPQAKSLVPELTEMLEASGRDGWYRPLAATLLGKIGSGAADAVPALTRAMQDHDLHVRFAAVKALGEIGPPADAAADALMVLVEDPQQPDRLRCRAALAVWHIRPSAPEVIPALRTALRLGAVEHREAALGAIQQMGPAAKEMVPALSEMLAEPALDRRIAISILRVLSEIGGDAQTATPAVLPLLENDDWQVQVAAARTLWAIDLQAPVVPTLVKMLRGGNVFAQESAAEAIGEIGRDAKEAVPDLVPLTGKKQPASLRIAAAYALWETAQHESALPTLIALLDSEDVNTRDNAARTLSRIGPRAKDALPALERLQRTAPAPAVDQAIRSIRNKVLPDDG